MTYPYAQVVFNLPVKGPFDYIIPPELRNRVKNGTRVWAPFGRRTLVGYVVGFSSKPGVAVSRLKEIKSLIDAEPIINAPLLKLSKWLSKYYFCSPGEAIEAAIPGGLKKGRVSVKSRLKENISETKEASKSPPILNSEQKAALREVSGAIEKSLFRVFLLHGITGSGKTEVYLQAIKRVLKKDKDTILLVPEISLTPQTVERFRERFGEKVAVLHSRLTAGQRFEEWKKVKEGRCPIVVGARSAVFAPVKKLGLLIIDEEHETTYKQEDVPRYNARDTGIARAREAGAAVILGSATPSLESFYNASKNRYKFLELNERVDGKMLPGTTIVDMREELKSRKRFSVFSRMLEEAMGERLKRKEQIILFLNRRGFSTFIHCRKCGFVFKCRRCSIALTHHSGKRELICHYCGYSAPYTEICPQCKGAYLGYSGTGTQKVESETARLFPAARIERMDTDTTAKRGSHRRILSAFKRGELDILVGTQMIAKGLDFPRVTLVGIIMADTALNLPDFRAQERTFQLLTQVSGRAGRGERKGEVIIQTFAPENYAIVASSRHDYAAFYKKEITYRRELGYPPFLHLIHLTLRGTKEDKVVQTIQKLAFKLTQAKACGYPAAALKGLPEPGKGNSDTTQPKSAADNYKIEVLGPAASPIPRIRGKFRWSIVLKTPTAIQGTQLLESVLKGFKIPPDLKLKVDVDPLGMM